MYSQVLNNTEDSGFKYKIFDNITTILSTFVLIICSGLFLKCTLKRRNYMNAYPSMKVSVYNVWGNLTELISMKQVKGITTNVYLLQLFMGCQQLFKHENFIYVSCAYIPFLVLLKAKAVEELISAPKNMEKNWIYHFLNPWLGTGLLTSHGSKWKSRRKLLTPSFHFDILKDFLPIFNEQSQLLVKLLQKETKQPWTDIVHPITLCSLDIICATTLGVSMRAQENNESEYVQAILRTSNVIMKRLVYPPYFFDWYFNLSSAGSQFKKDVKLLHNFTQTVIADKKQKVLNGTPKEKEVHVKKRRALMDLLLDEHIQNKSLTEDDIREEVDTFAFEGHDTTAMGMSWALYLIGLYNDVQEKILEEIDQVFGDDCDRPVTTDDFKYFEYLDRVLKESQRLYPSVPVISRKLSEDTMLCGFKVPKEAGILISPYVLHRDAEVFPDPEKFDPDRFLLENTAKRSPFAYIPFSAGPRNCIGQRFALMEEKVVIINILRNYVLESLDPRDKVPCGIELTLRPAVPIRIKLRSRRPS